VLRRLCHNPTDARSICRFFQLTNAPNFAGTSNECAVLAGYLMLQCGVR
jgi:hypothetical protein